MDTTLLWATIVVKNEIIYHLTAVDKKEQNKEIILFFCQIETKGIPNPLRFCWCCFYCKLLMSSFFLQSVNCKIPAFSFFKAFCGLKRHCRHIQIVNLHTSYFPSEFYEIGKFLCWAEHTKGVFLVGEKKENKKKSLFFISPSKGLTNHSLN